MAKFLVLSILSGGFLLSLEASAKFEACGDGYNPHPSTYREARGNAQAYADSRCASRAAVRVSKWKDYTAPYSGCYWDPNNYDPNCPPGSMMGPGRDTSCAEFECKPAPQIQNLMGSLASPVGTCYAQNFCQGFVMARGVAADFCVQAGGHSHRSPALGCQNF